ncbi:MAG: DNA polymerase III subunit beta [Prevotella sp.]|nr:DNA polymerase III subunit beta [Prevotella sp.]
MRFMLSSTALSSRLLLLSKVLNNKNAMQILDCFLFEIENGKLMLTASDNENAMRMSIGLNESDQNGKFAINSHWILDAVKELPEQPLVFNVDMASYQVSISYQNGEFNFTAQNADEYPVVQEVAEGATTIEIAPSVLCENINRSIFATAQEELRPVMNGIYFDLTAESLTIVASDGHKLVRNRNYSIKSATPSAFILPKKPATLLRNVLAKGEANVKIRFNERNASVTFEEGTLTCRLIEGNYPNYNSVIPKDNPNKITIDRKGLMSVLRRVLPFASDSSQLIRLHLEPGKLELSSKDLDFSTSAKENIVCEYTGQIMDIGFKGGSLTEILGNINSDEIIIELADPSRAGIIVPSTQPENEEVLMLIMPMLLND